MTEPNPIGGPTTRAAIFAAAAFVLASCANFIPSVEIHPSLRPKFQEFLRAPDHKAFATTGVDTGERSVGVFVSAKPTARSAFDEALRGCRAQSKGRFCAVYQVDDRVVWRMRRNQNALDATLAQLDSRPQRPSSQAATQAAQPAHQRTEPRRENSELVFEIQRQLIELRYLDRTADGVANRSTTRAIERFQRDSDLRVDGKPSSSLLISLTEAATTQRLSATPRIERIATPGRRVALVVGNADYSGTSKLNNTRRDATAIARKLRSIDFEVSLVVDANAAEFRNALRHFRREYEGARLAIFYYAGHAVQVDGENFLLPIDAQIEQPSDLAYDAVSLDTVMSEVQRIADSRIVVLDACRDNPFLRQLAAAMPASRSSSLSRGLARTGKELGTLIAYATAPDSTAADGTGAHSPYANALLSWIDTPGMEIGEVFRRVRGDVVRATNRQQIPWDESSLIGPGIYLVGTGDR